MVSVIGKTPAEIMDELEAAYGKFVMAEDNLRFAPEAKAEIDQIIMADKKLPELSEKISRVNYEDGCKVYFENGDFVICRFSGTEPLLRIFAESHDKQTAISYIDAFREFLHI